MKLTHIGISQFRSIGAEPVMIDLTKRITVLVGQNDCGKSNVLRGMELISKTRQEAKQVPLSKVDHHKRKTENPPLILLKCLTDASEQIEVRKLKLVTISAPLEQNLNSGCSCKELEGISYGQVQPLLREFGLGSSYAQPQAGETLELIGKASRFIAQSLRPHVPACLIVPQFRRIDDAGSYAIDGKGVVKLLAKWQHPDIGEDDLRRKFDRIVKLLRELLNRPNAILEVPAAQKEIIVAADEMRLPLESHGTGVHQLIILAIAVLSEDNVLFGIEEPEIHLHPVLQRRFLQFLLNETSNRYVITTHSSALIAPSEEVDVIHLKMVDGVTIPTRVDTDANALAVLEDLGVRASDLLQANSVIWVEGPSDRIYLNRWLELMDVTLREGVDYAIMFYGGRLLSHLSLEREDTDVNGFIKLLRINQRSAILIDSDRSDAGDNINATKQRIQMECGNNHLHAWLTDGREIENYLTKDCVDAALVEHGAKSASITIRPFEGFETGMKKACGTSFKPSWAYEDHKPAWAHRFVKHMTRDQITGELEMRLQALIAFIKARL